MSFGLNSNETSHEFPTLEHITLADVEYVYEPSDDTFLLCDAIGADISHIIEKRPVTIMEIG